MPAIDIQASCGALSIPSKRMDRLPYRNYIPLARHLTDRMFLIDIFIGTILILSVWTMTLLLLFGWGLLVRRHLDSSPLSVESGILSILMGLALLIAVLQICHFILPIGWPVKILVIVIGLISLLRNHRLIRDFFRSTIRARYTQHHHRALTLGPTSPLGLLCRDGGCGLLLGVGYHANTVHHLAEYMNRAPCHGHRTLPLSVKLPDGRIVQGRTWGYRGQPCPITDETRYAAAMSDRRLETVGMIGSSRVTTFRLQDCVDLITTFLQNGLESHPPCRDCPIRPREVGRCAESDWDKETGTLLPDSDAWNY